MMRGSEPRDEARSKEDASFTVRDFGPDQARTPLFLHRQTYRRRRVMDAARLLPMFGGVLLLLPALWESDHSTAMGAVYLFLAWIGLIAFAGVLSHRLSEPLRELGRSAEPSYGPAKGGSAAADQGPQA